MATAAPDKANGAAWRHSAELKAAKFSSPLSESSPWSPSSGFSPPRLGAILDGGMLSEPSLKRAPLARLQFFTGAKGEQMTRLFDCLGDVQVWIKDRRRHYVWVNHAFLKNYAINKKAPAAELSQVQ